MITHNTTNPIHFSKALNRRELLQDVALGALSITAFGAHSVIAAQSKQKNILILGGLVVNAHKSEYADILIKRGKIAEISTDLSSHAQTSHVIDAEGLKLLPGGIDPHVHLTPPFIDDFESGSKAALAGGITTVGAMLLSFNNDKTILQFLSEHSELVKKQSIADVMLHPLLYNHEQINQLSGLVDAGITTIKIFTPTSVYDQNYDQFVKVFHKCRELGILPMIHCEDRTILQEARSKLVELGHTSYEYYEESRPVTAEVLAIQKVIALCELTNCPIYIVHLSSERALQVCKEAQNRGLPVYVETRPLYLHFTGERYKTTDGPLFVGEPPIRSIEDQNALWEGLKNGSIHTLSTDHAPWSREQKFDPIRDITNTAAGINNLQAMLPMIYSEGVMKNRISLERFVELSSTNAAKLFGLYPEKGVLQVGSDADICIWDPKIQSTISVADGYSRSDFSIYEGWKLNGGLRMTIRRGKIAFENGHIHQSAGSGQLLKRRKTLSLKI